MDIWPSEVLKYQIFYIISYFNVNNYRLKKGVTFLNCIFFKFRKTLKISAITIVESNVVHYILSLYYMI